MGEDIGSAGRGSTRRKVTVREFRPEDYKEVVDLWRRSGLSVGDSDSYEEIRKKLSRDPDLFIVAVAGPSRGSGTGERIVGAVMGGWDGRRAWVYHLAVDPGFQRTGIGTMLMNELERRVKDRGAIKMSLLVFENNVKAISFYEKLGFSVAPGIKYVSKPLRSAKDDSSPPDPSRQEGQC